MPLCARSTTERNTACHSLHGQVSDLEPDATDSGTSQFPRWNVPVSRLKRPAPSYILMGIIGRGAAVLQRLQETPAGVSPRLCPNPYASLSGYRMPDWRSGGTCQQLSPRHCSYISWSEA